MGNGTAPLCETIADLKRKRNAVILAHNYQLGEVQDVADYVGDSLGLSVKVKDSDADVIVFCGVTFMVETAAILCPDKTVLLPVLEAGCPMADMAAREDLIKLKAAHPDAVVVCYVNSTAEVKSECDVCCTSANAVDIVNGIPADREVIFVPDRYLGQYVEEKTGRKMILWPGFCPTHARLDPEHVARRKGQYPDAVVMVHPECAPDVIALADQVLSTGGMIRFAAETDEKTIIVGTESGIIHRLEKENPDKRFVALSEQAVCPNMKMIRLEDVARSLESKEHVISVPEVTRERALKPIMRMLEGKPQR